MFVSFFGTAAADGCQTEVTAKGRGFVPAGTLPVPLSSFVSFAGVQASRRELGCGAVTHGYQWSSLVKYAGLTVPLTPLLPDWLAKPNIQCTLARSTRLRC